MLGQISQRLIGYRVKAAREAVGWTQDRLAKAMDLKDRQSVSDIENGKRALKPDELVLLADTLDRELDFFLNPFQVAGEAQFSWRASPGLAEDSLDGFELRAGQWIGLLRWLRENEQDRSNPLKHTLRLTTQSSYEDAIVRAESLGEALDLGVVPAERLAEKIEQELDIPVLYVDTIETPEGDSISGATCHLQEMSMILINRNELLNFLNSKVLRFVLRLITDPVIYQYRAQYELRVAQDSEWNSLRGQGMASLYLLNDPPAVY